jgi:hypothetical protein
MQENKGWIEAGKTVISYPLIEIAVAIVLMVMQQAPIPPRWTNLMLIVALVLIVISAYRILGARILGNIKVSPRLRLSSPRLRLLITVVVAVVAAIPLYGLFWKHPPEPLVFSAGFSARDTPDGFKSDGIKWRGYSSELRVMISNKSGQIYEDLDIVLQPEAIVAKIGYEGHGYSDVTLEHNTGMSFDGAHFGNKTVPSVLLATNMGYRMRCAKLWPKGSVIIVMALVTIKPEKQLDTFVMEDVFRDMPYWVLPAGIDKDGRVWYGHPDANIYAERPKQLPAATIKGVFTSGQQSVRFSERIVAKEMPHIEFDLR